MYVVGELKIASQMQMKENEKQNNKMDAFRQRKREIQCALNLVEKLQPYIDSGANDQVISCLCIMFLHLNLLLNNLGVSKCVSHFFYVQR